MNHLTRRLDSRRFCALGVLSLATAGGCAAPFMPNYLSGSRRQEAAAEAATAEPATIDPVLAANDPKTVSLRKALGEEPTTPDEALEGVLDELQAIHAIDPAAQQQVMEDLKGAKPELYPVIVRQFQAALEYRQQLAERAERERLQLAEEAHQQPATPGANVQVVARRPSAAAAADPTVPTVESVAPPQEAIVASHRGSGEVEQVMATGAAAGGPDRSVQQATINAVATQHGDWHAELEAAIADLERRLPQQPSTVADLNEHFQLRVLQLVAGREEDAYRPIPGASPAQQDYWSKQLFAMGAYLKGAGTVDDKQRAASALVHLDDARAALAQLATLQIRNLAFVKKVDGFGAYEPLAEMRFEPGTPVTLYAEVENFASTSTKDGYETILSTSYQVVDASGRRIDGGQFPDVSDVCRGRRRDFHLQYGVTLPTRISPGQYQLELTITDQRSGKIGNASLPLEINAER